MTARRPCPPAPDPLEDYATRFDDLFFSLAQRRGFREDLTGLLAPREQPATAPHDGGVIVIDDSGDRKDGTATAHVDVEVLRHLCR